MNRVLVLLLALVFFAGCGSLPKWVNEGVNETVWISWHKNQEGVAFVSDGACHVFSADSENGFYTLGPQIRACFDRTLPKGQPKSEGSKKIQVVWNRVSEKEIVRRHVEIYGLGGKNYARNLFYTTGFYFYAGGICHIVVPVDRSYEKTLGHEFKHCVDGRFHDRNHKWF